MHLAHRGLVSTFKKKNHQVQLAWFRLIVWLGQINAPAAPLEGVMLQLFARQIVECRLSAICCLHVQALLSCGFAAAAVRERHFSPFVL